MKNHQITGSIVERVRGRRSVEPGEVGRTCRTRRTESSSDGINF
jgi:hypothetical protein